MAVYDLSKPMRRAQFERRAALLIKAGRFVELKEITNRSLKQNSYLHLILSYYAIEFGYTLEYTKRHIFKIIVNPDIFIINRTSDKTGEIYKDLQSTAKTTKADLITAINRFKDHAAKGGLYLPDPDNLIYLREILESIESNKQYL